MTLLPMPDPYKDDDTPFRLGGRLYDDEFEAFRDTWRRGAALDELYPDGPFALREPVGSYKTNHPGDVAKVQSLLHDVGYMNANETEGPTGIFSRALLEEPIKRFQKDHDLEVDGYLEPDGETIGALQSLLDPHTGRNPFDPPPEAVKAAPKKAQPQRANVPPIEMAQTSPAHTDLNGAEDRKPAEAPARVADAANLPEWFKPKLPKDKDGNPLPPTPGDPRFNADGTIKESWLQGDDKFLGDVAWGLEHVGWDPKKGEFFLYKNSPDDYRRDIDEGGWRKGPFPSTANVPPGPDKKEWPELAKHALEAWEIAKDPEVRKALSRLIGGFKGHR